MAFLSKYAVARHIYIPLIKRGVVDFAVSADWTPAAGDVKISKDGGAAANVTDLPTAITMGNAAMWDFSLSSTEMTAAQVLVTIADSATKAVEDQQFDIETYGNASAQHVFDLGTAMSGQAVSSVTGAVGSVTGAVGSVTGAVGSVTGAVGSVTGNVGGNVVGSVASVTGNVGGNVVGSVASVTAAVTVSGDFSATMKTSIGTAVAASAVASVTGNVGGNVTGSVGSVTGLTASNLDATVSSRLASASYTAPDNTSITAIKGKTDNLPSAPADETLVIAATTSIMNRLGAPAGASVSADIATRATPANILTTALTESYAGDGVAPTLSQSLFAIQQFLQERGVAGTTLTVNKLDGTTAAMTFTLNDGTAPTAITRAT